ncbi:APC family permease [Mycoplasmopsis felifaucium]|uniref:APC family permease n=1 Tax=Mycoplasmopsis felifaucium TaxID=35768 RepID=UPI0004891F43|nr:APC family permease [Mycoplasmopsis felifaucium]
MGENVTQTKEKKISFISAMLIVIGGSIGAGIFFKSGSVLSNSHSSLVLAIFCWLIASCAVIAMALALVEISSVKNDNLSLMSWTKVFNSKRIYRASKDFMTYIYLPLTYFFMPLYVILSLQDGFTALLGKDAVFNTKADWTIWLVISLVMSIYFLTIPAYWSKVGDIQNIVVLAVKFIPLVFIAVMGFVLAIAGKGGTSEVHALVQNTDPAHILIKQGEGMQKFGGIGAGLGVFLAVSAIFFAYDGFYVAAGIQSEMKEPKKTPAAIFLGLAITTLIYVIIAISMSINGGSFFSMKDYMANMMGAKAASILFGIVNICIAIGVLGIINGFSMWAPRFVEDLLATGDLPLWEKFQGKLNANKPKVGIIYSLVLTIPVVVVFTIIGALAYLPTNPDYAYYVNAEIDVKNSMQRLYSFADLMANWTALFTFGFIAIAIYGGIKNRTTNKVLVTDKKKYFLPMAWISVIIVFAALFVTAILPIFDLILVFGFDKEFVAQNIYNTKVADASKELASGTSLEAAKLTELKASADAAAQSQFIDLVVGRSMLVVVLVVFILLSFLPASIEDVYHAKKYGSVEKYEAYVESKLKAHCDVACATA